MRYLLLLLLLIVAACTPSDGNGNGQQGEPSNDLKPDSLAGDLLDVINAQRAQPVDCFFGFRPATGDLTWNNKLASAAERHVKDMLREVQDDPHLGSDNTCVWDRVVEEGYIYINIGENIARGFAIPEDVVNGENGWLSSDAGHCGVLMNDDFMEMGAYEEAGIWTAVFASPSAADSVDPPNTLENTCIKPK